MLNAMTVQDENDVGSTLKNPGCQRRVRVAQKWVVDPFAASAIRFTGQHTLLDILDVDFGFSDE